MGTSTSVQMSTILKSEHEKNLRGSPYCKNWQTRLKITQQLPVIDILNEKSKFNPANILSNKNSANNTFDETSSDENHGATTDSDNEIGFYSYVSMNSGVYSKNHYMSIK